MAAGDIPTSTATALCDSRWRAISALMLAATVSVAVDVL
jgi:hypothetical protein